jgi:hypothetical protein
LAQSFHACLSIGHLIEAALRLVLGEEKEAGAAGLPSCPANLTKT